MSKLKLNIASPNLAKEWHPTKNGTLSPEDVTSGSGKKVWWKCPEGEDHEWQATVRNRNYGNGCPICSGHKVSKSTSLVTLNSELAKQWHPTKNGELTPLDVTPASNIKVWWKCPLGNDHEWKTTVAHRNSGKGCPICSGHKVARSTSIASLMPELAKEWHPTKNGNLSPNQVSPGSGKKAWWKCKKGDDHEWQSSVSNRAKGSGCPVCSNIKVGKSNSLQFVYPEIAKEWHPTKNGDLTPNDVVYGSHKKVWWQCIKGKDHVWKTSPGLRVLGTSCPFCTNPSSKPELRILAEIRTIFPSAQHRIFITGYEVDIYLPDLKIGIEYDGEYWHRTKKEQDLEKNKALEGEITLLRVREQGLPRLSGSDIAVKSRSFTIQTMKEILQVIAEIGHIKSRSTLVKIESYQDIKRWLAPDEFRALLAARKHIKYEDSVRFLFPEIAKQWHPTKNTPLDADQFTPSSNKKVWWKCPNGDDHEWESQIADRCLTDTGCPICANKKIVRSNCLATLDQELAKRMAPNQKW